MQIADNQVEKINKEKVTRLKELIEDHGGISKSFAGKIKMSPSYLSEVLNNKKDPPKYLSSKLRKFANVNETWFDTGEGDKYDLDSETKTDTEMSSLKKENEFLRKDNERLQDMVDLLKERIKDKDKLLDKSLSSNKDFTND